MPERAVVVIHGGYDSFMEEFYLIVRTLPQHGYTVILFEGPGQGQALLNGLTFTHAWEHPTAAILDFFQLSNVALLGISWGGYLALRAAAFEPRIQYVIAYDVCYDGFEVMTRPMPSPLRELFQFLIRIHARSAVNALIERLRKRSRLLDWAVAQGMHITGAKTPFEFYQKLTLHTMKGISHLVRQDVLLLAGQRDHYIPLEQFYQQQRSLVNAHSVTARLFTVSEGGEQHCQVGHHQLAVDEITLWLDAFAGGSPSRAVQLS
jgi:pimeloyl-ACP methyl ester carboxylesterase